MWSSPFCKYNNIYIKLHNLKTETAVAVLQDERIMISIVILFICIEPRLFYKHDVAPVIQSI